MCRVNCFGVCCSLLYVAVCFVREYLVTEIPLALTGEEAAVFPKVICSDGGSFHSLEKSPERTYTLVHEHPPWQRSEARQV